MAHTATYSLVGQQDGSKMRFIKYARAYEGERLDLGKLSDDERATHELLQGVIDEFAKTRPKNLRAD